MLVPDVNVLVYALRGESADHHRFRQWLHDVVNGPSDFGMSELVLNGLLRVATNPRIFATPTPPSSVLEFAEAIVRRRRCRLLRPGPRHFQLFVDLCRDLDLRGDDVSDGYHAALAIETGNEWVSADRGFARFPGLRWRHPLDA